MPEQSDSTAEILSRAGIFHGVDRAVVATVIRRLPILDFERGHTVFAEGEPGDGVYIIVAGKVKIGSRTADGRDNLLAIMGPSQMFGELSIFDPGPRTSSATTVTTVRAVSMDRDALRAWLAQHPALNEQLLRMLALRLRRTYDHMFDLGLADVTGRVAKQLLLLAHQFGVQEDGALRVTHDLTQEEIAQLVGAARETVNKALSDFAQRGWIQIEGKSVLILNTERLQLRTRTGSCPPTEDQPQTAADDRPPPELPQQFETWHQRRATYLRRPRRVGSAHPPIPSSAG